MSNAEYRMSNVEGGNSVNLMGLGREEGVLNVERRMTNIEYRMSKGECSEDDVVGRGRRSVECRRGKIAN